ncbi:C-type lectin mosGCTL-1-like [Glandiceps talaboti]
MVFKVTLLLLVISIVAESAEYGPICNCKYYRVYTDEVYWVDARLLCAEKGGTLATISDASTDNIIRSYIYDNSLDDEVRTGFWIGLQDRSQEGVYEWVDGEEFKFPECGSYSNWAPDEPNNNVKKMPAGQDCVQLQKRNGLMWDDEYCTGVRRKGYVCQFYECDLDFCDVCLVDDEGR